MCLPRMQVTEGITDVLDLSATRLFSGPVVRQLTCSYGAACLPCLLLSLWPTLSQRSLSPPHDPHTFSPRLPLL